MTSPNSTFSLLREPVQARIVQRVAELPDRTSPEDWPEAMLVTADELQDILADELEALLSRVGEAPPCVGTIAGLVNAYHNDATTLTAAETLRAIADALGPPMAPVEPTTHAPALPHEAPVPAEDAYVFLTATDTSRTTDPVVVRLRAFSRLTSGWSYGRGRAFSEQTIAKAEKIVELGRLLRLVPEVFPGTDGEVTVALHHGETAIHAIVHADLSLVIQIERGHSANSEDAIEPRSAEDRIAILRAFIEQYQVGGCKIISLGGACRCPLCALDDIKAALTDREAQIRQLQAQLGVTAKITGDFLRYTPDGRTESYYCANEVDAVLRKLDADLRQVTAQRDELLLSTDNVEIAYQQTLQRVRWKQRAEQADADLQAAREEIARLRSEAPRSTLFRLGEYTLHSGENSAWKIECDALTDDDIAGVALMVVHQLPEFGSVEGVPRGGLRLADALRGYCTKGPLLIVDDVTTTGWSLEEHRHGRNAIGAVLFARQHCPSWVTPLFQMPTARLRSGQESNHA